MQVRHSPAVLVVFRQAAINHRHHLYLPDHAALQTYRVLAPMAYAKIKNIIERNVTSGLIYLPSSARDLNNPQIDQYLAKYVRGSNGMDHVQRVIFSAVP